LTICGGVFSIDGSEAVVDSISTVITEHQSSSDIQQQTVGELVIINITQTFLDKCGVVIISCMLL